MKRLVLRFVVAGALAASVQACAVKVGESDLLRPVVAGTIDAVALAAAAPDYQLEEGFITAPDGARLYYSFLRQPDATTTVLYFGGNQFTLGKLGPAAARVFAPLGVNLMLVDHRGYGQSAGSPTTNHLMSDGLATYDHLVRLQGVDARNIIVHGQSLGSFVAGHVAANRDTAGVVLESSVTTTEEWVKARAGRAPVVVTVEPAIAGQGNSRNILRIEEPLMILVGDQDPVTPPALSEALYNASPLRAELKRLVIVPGAGHNDALRRAEATTAYREFLASAVR